MENISNKKVLNIVTLCIVLIIPFLKFLSLNLQMFGVINNYDSINPAVILYISVPILLFIYIKDIICKKRKLDIFDYIFYALLISGSISILFSIDKSIAMLGKEFRHEGFLSVLSYYLLFINYKTNGDNEDINKFIKLVIIIGLINAIYSIFQIYTDFNFISRYNKDPYMASGLCGNPNFFGSLIVTALSLIICKVLMDKKISIKAILIIILLFIALINAQSTGPFLTLILVFILLIIFLRYKRELVLKNVLVMMIILVSTYIGTFCINKYVFNIDRWENGISGLNENLETGGNGRLTIWKNSLEIIKHNSITGVGFDNFYLAYPNPKPETGTKLSITDILFSEKQEKKVYLIIDNAHNVYIHTLVSTGTLGFIPFVMLLFLTFVKGLKSKKKLLFILFSGFVAYSIQAFANISVIQVAPIYYIIIGLILSIKQ